LTEMAKILLVEDDRELSCMISACLAFDHYAVESVVDGKEAIARLRNYSYDLLLLDWGLPEMSGVEVCRKFRDAGGVTPILMVTARGAISEKADGLDSGADDYLTKPFDMTELSARIRALLRRSDGKYRNHNLVFQNIVLEPNNFRVTRSSVDIALSAKEFALLEIFMRHPGQIFPINSLINHVWSAGELVSHESVRQHIMNLRKKLEFDDNQPVIQTVRGLGYKLSAINQ
jgi:DNA-binding response OmpR family regulator